MNQSIIVPVRRKSTTLALYLTRPDGVPRAILARGCVIRCGRLFRFPLRAPGDVRRDLALGPARRGNLGPLGSPGPKDVGDTSEPNLDDNLFYGA
jgi:hypothetical protein